MFLALASSVLASLTLRNLCRLCAAVTGFGAITAALASSSDKVLPESPYLIRAWSTDDGLPYNLVSQVGQDRTGFLWLATTAGLVRFDGREFKLVPLPNRPPGRDSVRAFAFQRDDTIVFIPATGGLFTLKNNIVAPHPLTPKLAHLELREVFVEPDGAAVWVSAEEDGFLRCTADSVRSFGPAEGVFRRRTPVTWAMDKDGRTWIATSELVAYYEAGNLVKVNTTRRVNFRVAQSRNGGPWILGEALFRWQNGAMVQVAELPWPRGRAAVQSMYEDKDGTLWLGTSREGVFYFDGTGFHALPINEPAVSSVIQDREGNVWLATNGGLRRVRRQMFTWLNYPATGIAEEPGGVLWFAAGPDGLIRRAEHSVAAIPLLGTRDTMQVRAVVLDRQGRTWIAARTGFYVTPTAQPGETRRLTEPANPPIDAANARLLCRTDNGDIWTAGVGLLGYFRNDVFTSLIAQMPPASDITVLIEDTRKCVWIGTATGEVYRCVNDRIALAHGKLTGGTINAILPVDEEALWIATSRGLVHVDRDRIRVFTEDDGLPSNAVLQALRDDRGHLWLTTPHGLTRVDAEELRRVAAGEKAKVDVTNYGPDEGVVNLSPYSDSQPSAWKDQAGRLWFCTYNGVLGFDPQTVGSSSAPVPVFIDEVRVNGERVAAQTTLEFPSKNQQLEFRFVALGFAAPERIRLRHRLEGWDSSWIETSPDRRARYGNLAPGNYRLRVEACNSDGVWNPAETPLTVHVRPRWWQTIWCRIATLLVTAVSLGLTVRYVSHRSLTRRLEKLEREHAIERERARIARDMHDDLGGTITSINLAVQRLKSACAGESSDIVNVVDRRVRQLSLELDRVVWTVSPKNGSLDQLVAFVSHFAQQYFADSPIRSRIHGAESIPAIPLTPDEQHHLLALTKEVFNNALKHSHATEIVVHMDYDGREFRLSVRDNGVGFDANGPGRRRGNGLSNIHARVAELAGTAKLTTAPAAGTHLEVCIPLPGVRASTRRN